MKKLNKKKIQWIVKEVERRDKGVYSIAKQQDITPRWARQVHKTFRHIKDPVLKKPGRKPTPISSQERKIVVKTYHEYKVGATMIEQIFDEKGFHINHNRIHRILLEEGLAKQESKKKKYLVWKRWF